MKASLFSLILVASALTFTAEAKWTLDVSKTVYTGVDDLGAKSERMSSGIFNRDMTPKAAARMLDRLINREWRTELEVTADGDGKIAFRGFRGRYELVWTDAEGRPVRKEAEL